MNDLPQCCHGDDGVPETRRDRRKCRVGHVFLAVEHYRGKDDDSHGQWEDEKAQLAGAGLQGVAQNSQSLESGAVW